MATKAMTTKQYLNAIAELGLSKVGAAVLGLSPRQAQRLAAGAAVPKPLAHLIRVMLKFKIKPDELDRI